MADVTIHCPCSCGKKYSDCCGRYLDGGEAAPDACALMRSRYTAYTLAREDYLLSTWHSSTRPAALSLADEAATRWLGLEVKRHEQRDANGHGKCVTPDGETCDARFPDGTISHSTRLSKSDNQVAGYLSSSLPQAGESDKVSLREFHVAHATVEFVARYKINGRAHRLHEVSRFVREHGLWFYVDGDIA